MILYTNDTSIKKKNQQQKENDNNEYGDHKNVHDHLNPFGNFPQ